MSHTEHKSSIFLMELILALFFFSLASAVCMQLFAKSHLARTQTEELNYAIPLSESAAEGFQSVSGDLKALAPLFPESRLNDAGDILSIFYDENWKPLGTESSISPVYTLTVSLKKDELPSSIVHASVQISKDSSSIYRLPVSVQIPRTVPAAISR
ncbi:hypothetical protein [Qiania dongpingensis]|uniref:Uncharacterized protein n=1 Tax=Qiania dongpingensis TaxID=2763669 RepID=A0A7G9G8F8_9FIRM|nr:hypothetical protein [Qiania dongpingensis]QNM07090.1 hypothetical protein H9Q78_03535 [Qiania dongpingensis]